MNKMSRMKTKIIFSITTSILMLWLSFSSVGQNGYFENNPVWKVTSQCGAPSPCIETKNYNYYVNGDTTINTYSYKKLFTKGNQSFAWMNIPPVPPECQGYYVFNDTINPFAFVRDTLKKIFIYDVNLHS